MIQDSLAQNVLEAALSTGGEFAELFMEHTENTSVTVINGKTEKAVSGIDSGIGIRVFDGTNAIYSYTNDFSEVALMHMAHRTAEAVKKKSSGKNSVEFQKRKADQKHVVKILPREAAKKERVDCLKEASEAAFAFNKKITQTRCVYSDSVQDVTIANSEGLWISDQRVRSRFSVEAIASSDCEKQSGRFSPGAQSGFELLNTLDVKYLAQEAARIAVTMLGADLCPGGKMPVVIDNGFGGVIFHEACGHSLEATAVARNASVFAGKLGEKIASDVVTAIDDGTIANGWGSENIDDEGIPSQRTVLIENGILKNYLIDRLNGLKMGMKPTGSARRESYRYAPTSRMTNTFIAPGKSTVEEIIAATEFGLYAKQMGGGSVEPATGVFNFAVLEGYMIRNGKIAEPVRGATLIGKGSEVLMKIDMVGNNLARAQGMCGSVSGSVPVDVGQPMIRVSESMVGGRR